MSPFVLFLRENGLAAPQFVWLFVTSHLSPVNYCSCLLTLGGLSQHVFLLAKQLIFSGDSYWDSYRDSLFTAAEGSSFFGCLLFGWKPSHVVFRTVS